MSDRKTLFLIDGHALAYRMFFAMQQMNLSADGKPTGAVYGFVNTILSLMDNHKPDYFGVVFDPSGPTFRNEMYDKYKATRQKMPEDLRDQIPLIGEVLTAMNCNVIEVKRFEADDVIGTLAKRFEQQDIEVILYTSDKDYMQLVSDKVKMLKPGMRGKPDQFIGIPEVNNKFGVNPDKVIEALAMIGDTSDNVPGIDGIGEKTAGKLLQKHGSLDAILADPQKVKNKKINTFFENPIHFDLIKLSRQLVTIDIDAPVEAKIEDFRLPNFDNTELFELFKRLKFRSFMNRFSNESQGELDFGAKRDQATYHLVDSWDKFEKVVDQLKKSKGFAFDTETTHPNQLLAKTVGISFAIKGGEAWYIPLAHVEKGTFKAEDPQPLSGNLNAKKVWAALKPILEDASIPKYAHNYKYDAMVLLNDVGIDVQPYSYDTMVAAWVLDPARRQNGLKDLSLELLNYQMITYQDVCGKGKDEINFAEVDLQTATDYGAEDSDFTVRLKDRFDPQLKENDLEKLFFDIEMPLVEVLTQMEMDGVSIDAEFFGEMSVELADSLAGLEKEIYELAGKEFNINSTKQLRVVFYDDLDLDSLLYDQRKIKVKKTPKGELSTAADVLELLAGIHELPSKIVEYRELAKLKGTYVDALPKMINPNTGRIHTSYNQTVAPTGRLSTSDPGLQNIPIRTELGRRIRKGFVPGDGFDLLMAADYSQIELRVLAHYAGDGALTEAFRKDEDIHTRTAAAVFGCDMEEVTRDQRRTAKTTNFGIVYGQTAFGLANALNITRSEAQSFIDRYFETYPGVKDFIDSTIAQAHTDGFVTTLYGRRRPLPDLKSKNGSIRQYAERTAVNTPIQGSAADMIKLAMIRIHRQMRDAGFKSRMILQVHDELVFEVKKSELDALTKLVTETMESALPLDVPVKVETGTGPSWFEAH